MTDNADRIRPKLADLRDVETVYQPAEDSRLLAESVATEIAAGERVLDVGTGSGYVAHTIAKTSGAAVVGIDINPNACRQAASAGVPTVRGDMFDPFQTASFDVVVCNPPYLPTPPDQEWDDWMEAALSGGADGRAMVTPFIRGLGRVLTPEGRAYLLISTLTDPDAVEAIAAEEGFDTRVLAEESYPFERLLVLALTVD